MFIKLKTTIVLYLPTSGIVKICKNLVDQNWELKYLKSRIQKLSELSQHLEVWDVLSN